MSSRCSYQIANVEEGKAAGPDQSFKTCVITLLIFFFLCIIFIIIGACTSKLYNSHDLDQQIEAIKGTEDPDKSHERYVGYGGATGSTKYTLSHTTPVTENNKEELGTTQPIIKKHKEHVHAGNTLLPSTEEDKSKGSTSRNTTEASTSTELNEIDKKVSSNEYEDDRQTTDKQLANSETSNEYTIATTEVSASTQLKASSNESESDRETTDKQLASSEMINEITSTKVDIFSITEKYKNESSTSRNTTEASTFTELNEIDKKVSSNEYEDDRQTTDKQLASSEMINEITSTKEDIFSITEKYKNESSTSRNTTEVSTSTELDALFSTVEENEGKEFTDTITTEASTRYSILSTINDSITTKPVIPTTTMVPESSTKINNEVCISGECKNLASKMLFYMNHMIDPCEDFYEYACGGFEANPQVIERTLEDVAYQRILHEMQKENDRSSSFATYYNSCLQYESISQTERIQLAKVALSNVGSFFNIGEEWNKNPVNFTELVAKLLLYNSPLLFDVTPDLDEYSPKQFTLKIGPTTLNNPFDTDKMNDPCRIDQFKEENEMVNLKELYIEYINCKNDAKQLADFNTKAFNALGICNQTNFISNLSSNNTFNYSQCLTTMNTYIDIELVQNFLQLFPTKDKIREAYLMKNYKLFTIEKLQEEFKVINWTQLIKSLTKEWIQPNITVQVYFYDALAEGMKNLYEFAKENPMNLHNALLGLYASKLYHEFVLSKHEDAKKHCLRVAANVFIQEASHLYISSFTKDQLTYMNRTIHSLFFNLTETLKLTVKKADWITEDGYDALIAKIDNLQIATPNASDYLSQERTNQVNLSDSYFENSMTLMNRYREQMYEELTTNPGNPKQIWTHYATPYLSKGVAIYGLNLIVIPFGAIDWSFEYDQDQFDYITLATAGNVIAHEIAHHFDANGIYYWNGTRDTKNSLFNESDSKNINFKVYIENQKNTYLDPMNIILPFTGQTVTYEISQLTLNERLSEAMGLRLTYDTLYRLRSSKEVNLPWLEFHFDQLFYLAYAQMHCTKSPLTSSYVSLYENEYLPSRIRILVSASNNKLLGEAWNCSLGSPIMPSDTFSAFPYLKDN